MAASRRAKATAQLLKQVDALVPQRNKSSDGWIGDTSHQATKSDHNPNSKGAVRAQDISHDPAGGFDSYSFAETLRENQDERIKYVISNRKIFSGPAGPSPWNWRPYSGKNPHDQHVHVSVGRDVNNGSDAKFYDDTSDWNIGARVGLPVPGAPDKTLPVLSKNDKGPYVWVAQTALGGATPDGKFGPMTEQALLQFQRDHGLEPDGKIGPYTWRELFRPWAKETNLLPQDPRAKLAEMAAASKVLGPDATVEQLVAAYIVVLSDLLPPNFERVPPAPVEPPLDLPPIEPPLDLPPGDKEYHAVVAGGFFSSDPYDYKVPTAVRTNNPGALNTTKYIATLPGYNTAHDAAGAGNETAIFWAPEYGILAYWDLLRRYREAGATTIRQIINRYGGGQDYSEYLSFVTKTTGLPGSYQIRIDGSDDVNLTKFCKAMFRYEAGVNTPLSDVQIKTGFGLGREHARMT